MGKTQRTWSKITMIGEDGEEHYLSGESDRLLYDGKPLLTEHKVTFGMWVNVAIVLASLATVIMAVFTVIDHCPQ